MYIDANDVKAYMDLEIHQQVADFINKSIEESQKMYLEDLKNIYFRPNICVADIVILDTYIILSVLCLIVTKLIIKVFNKSTKNKTQGFVETPTIKNYMKSHLITNITDGTEELWDESMGEIPYEYYNMIVIGDDGKGNILACHLSR